LPSVTISTITTYATKPNGISPTAFDGMVVACRKIGGLYADVACAFCRGISVRIFFILAFVVALALLGAQLCGRDVPDTQTTITNDVAPQTPVVVGTTWPEPISTVFILGGAAALGLWKLARKFQLV
jgi:hypothetical protein